MAKIFTFVVVFFTLFIMTSSQSAPMDKDKIPDCSHRHEKLLSEPCLSGSDFEMFEIAVKYFRHEFGNKIKDFFIEMIPGPRTSTFLFSHKDRSIWLEGSTPETPSYTFVIDNVDKRLISFQENM